MSNIDDLKWVRIFEPNHIPRYLVDQIKNKDFTTDDFYRYQKEVNLVKNNELVTFNPLNHLYILIDNENKVKGFVWLWIDELSKDLFLNTYSIDKEYWFNGKAVKKVANFIKDLKNKADLNKVFWITNYPKHSERYGFKRSKNILMEYSGEENGKNINGGDEKATEHQSFNPTATTVS